VLYFKFYFFSPTQKVLRSGLVAATINFNIDSEEKLGKYRYNIFIHFTVHCPNRFKVSIMFFYKKITGVKPMALIPTNMLM
jgi:hypothetical protein